MLCSLICLPCPSWNFRQNENIWELMESQVCPQMEHWQRQPSWEQSGRYREIRGRSGRSEILGYAWDMAYIAYSTAPRPVWPFVPRTNIWQTHVSSRTQLRPNNGPGSPISDLKTPRIVILSHAAVEITDPGDETRVRGWGLGVAAYTLCAL